MSTAQRAAQALVAAHQSDIGWLTEFAAAFGRELNPLPRVLTAWDLNQSEAARLFGVSRQAMRKWLTNGPPADRATDIADLAAATDLLARHLRFDRIPAVVRRRAANLNDRNLAEVAQQDGARAVLIASRAMFAFEDALA